MSGDISKVIITLELTEPQKIAIENILKCWNSLSNIGGSRWTAFYADGDGDFHPNATIDGRKPEYSELIDPMKFWEKNEGRDEFRVDFDSFAWALLAKEEGRPILSSGTGPV